MQYRVPYTCLMLLIITGCQSPKATLTKQQKCKEIAQTLHHQPNPHTAANKQNQHYLDQAKMISQWHENNCDVVLHDALNHS